MKKFLYIMSWVLAVLGTISILLGATIQTVVGLNTFGFSFKGIIVKHWSIFLYLGFIPLCIGYWGMWKL